MVQQQELHPICLLRHMPTMPWVLHKRVFSFRVEPPTNSYVICWCLLWCLLSAFSSCVAAMLTNGGPTFGIFLTTTHHSIPLAGIYASQRWSMAQTRGAQFGCFSHCFGYGGLHATHSAVTQPFHQDGGTYNLGAWQSHPIPPPSQHGREGSSFPDCVPHNDMVDSTSVAGIKLVDSGLLTGYQVDEFTCTWLPEGFVA